MIHIVDYGLGNLLSVAKAFESVPHGRNVVVSAEPDHLAEADFIVLPGVGSFRRGMDNLHDLQLVEPLKQQIMEERKPFFGICLGMHLLAEIGEEEGATEGLGCVPGHVRALKADGLKMPHIGWDDLHIQEKKPLFSNVAQDKEFYFVHGYIFDCPQEYIAATCTYGETFAAAIHKDNIFATQFHPEKSRERGLRLLANFLRYGS